MLLSPYPTLSERVRIGLIGAWCVLVILFLIAPILVPVPLSVNSGSFFTFPLAGFSLRWYRVVLGPGEWRAGIEHSLLIAACTTVAATVLGTLAAVGLSSPRFPARRAATVLLISPLAVPVIIIAVGVYLFYAPIGLASTFQGIILAHTVLASPLVVVTVGASLAGFDRTTMRAASICGARPFFAFRRGMLPMILPGVLSGAAFAFVTSFDEVVVALFLASARQRTLPIVMFTGLREQLSPAITAAATLMMSISILLLVVAEVLRRRRQADEARIASVPRSEPIRPAGTSRILASARPAPSHADACGSTAIFNLLGRERTRPVASSRSSSRKSGHPQTR